MVDVYQKLSIGVGLLTLDFCGILFADVFYDCTVVIVLCRIYLVVLCIDFTREYYRLPMFKTIITSITLLFLAVTFCFASPAQAQLVTMQAGAQEVGELNLEVEDELSNIVGNKVNEQPNNIILFTEQEGIVLDKNLQVTLLVENANDSSLNYNGMITVSKTNHRQYAGSISAGTKVTSFLLHFNHSADDRVTEVASFAFDQRILGLIYDGVDLNKTDNILGIEGVTYAQKDNPLDDDYSLSRRTVTNENADYIMVIPDQNAVVMYSRVGTKTDQVRVIVAAP
ncbi:MAG: hypothetical protein AAGG51_07180 [Cyanobacteria bacterium P01_G01_bin.54]